MPEGVLTHYVLIMSDTRPQELAETPLERYFRLRQVPDQPAPGESHADRYRRLAAVRGRNQSPRPEPEVARAPGQEVHARMWAEAFAQHTHEQAARIARRRTRRKVRNTATTLPISACLAAADRAEDSEDELISDGPILETALHIETGQHARRVPVRVSSLDEVTHDSEGDPRDAEVPGSLPRVRRGIEGLKALISFGPRKTKTVVEYIRRWNSFVEWCDQEAYDPWVFSPTVFELFAGWKYELNKTKSIDVYASSFNYIYRVHNLYPAFKDGRIREVKAQFRKAAQARRNEEGEEYLRTDMPSRAVLYLLSQLADHQHGVYSKINSERIVSILILLLFWVRGSTFGHSKPGDLKLVQGLGGPTLTFTLTRVKRGPQLYAPTTMGIPLVPPAGNRAAPLFEMIHRHIRQFPDFSGESLGLTFDTAADIMTDWIRFYMPREAVARLGLTLDPLPELHGITHYAKSAGISRNYATPNTNTYLGIM